MHSSLISKIEKARLYAQERERVTFQQFTATFRGEHDTYTVTYDAGRWACTCPFFQRQNTCSHTRALEQILGEMLPSPSSA
ncbi:MAG: SWIM zinc finger family protein [Dehalococcoidia bacterium]|nr:SWIM zinc finger family protein [Dehalococcoidia bacterium]MDW8119412.1 SWIM zinc finger family protein [Chloroflexota bacterium]